MEIIKAAERSESGLVETKGFSVFVRKLENLLKMNIITMQPFSSGAIEAVKGAETLPIPVITLELSGAQLLKIVDDDELENVEAIDVQAIAAHARQLVEAEVDARLEIDANCCWECFKWCFSKETWCNDDKCCDDTCDLQKDFDDFKKRFYTQKGLAASTLSYLACYGAVLTFLPSVTISGSLAGILLSKDVFGVGACLGMTALGTAAGMGIGACNCYRKGTAAKAVKIKLVAQKRFSEKNVKIIAALEHAKEKNEKLQKKENKNQQTEGGKKKKKKNRSTDGEKMMLTGVKGEQIDLKAALDGKAKIKFNSDKQKKVILEQGAEHMLVRFRNESSSEEDS